MANANVQQYLDKVKNQLPPYCTRKEVCDALGGKLSTKTLANLDSRKEGPPDRIVVGRKVMYNKDKFMEWLANRITG